MRFTLDPGGDVVVPDGVTLDRCRDGLARIAGRPELRDAPLTVAGRVLPPDHVAGAPPWVAGAVLTWAPHGAATSAARPPVDPAAAASTAAWHVAVVAGHGTGEVLAPDPPGLRVALPLPAATRIVQHRPAGRVRGRRWWVEPASPGDREAARPSPRARWLPLASAHRRRGPATARRRRVRPGERLVLGTTVVEVRPTGGASAPARRRLRTARSGGRAGRGDAAAVGGGVGAAVGQVASRTDPVLRVRLRSVRDAVLQPGVVVPVVGSLVLAAVLRSPVLAVMGLVGPLALLLQRRDRTPRGPGTPVGEPVSRGEAGAASDGPRPVLPPPAGTVLTDPAAAAVRAAAGRSGRTGHGRFPTGAAADRPRAPVPGRVEESPWWPFAADGGLAVVGPADRAADVVRAMLADALADATLPLAVLQPAGSSWGWLRWTGMRLAGRSGSRVARTSAQAEEVLAGCTGRVLVLDAHGASRRPALHRWWVRDRAAPAGLLLLEDRASDLPVWCPWVLEVREVGDDAESADGGDGPAGPGAVLHGPDGSAVPVLAPGVTEAWAEQHARRCAALPVLPHPDDDAPLGADGASPDGRVGDRPDPVPARVSLEDLGLPTTRGAVLRTWSAHRDRRRLDLLLGADEQGTVRADLVAEGPHALVAGTTGAGKSELLQTLLLSLALTHPPAEVAMVLLDYKGGAGFGRTRDLPHVAGMVTDLDPVRAARALEGLRAELRRREALLAAADVTDVADLPQAPPRLVVVVDEFRALVEDLPEFVPALVRTATQGRSLGVHLVLATQRPSGVVDAQLRANLPLRVCLRVTDPADSLDVVDVPDAAGISARTPGRAVVSRPGGTAEMLQTAWAALPGTARAPAAAAVRPGDPWATWSPWRHPDAPVGAPTHAAPSPDVVEHLVREVDAAHRRTGRPAPVAPWLPTLPERLAAADLPGLEGLGLGGLEPEGFEPEVFEPEDLAQHAGTPAESTPGPPPPPFAVRDLPDLRRRDAVHWDRRGHLAVVGGPGSGRTTTLRTLAAGALATGAEVHVLTAGSEADWRGLDRHPGMGTVVGPHDPARALSLVDALLAGGGAQRAAGPAHGPVGLVPVGLPPVGLPPVGLPPVGLSPAGRAGVAGARTVLCLDDVAGLVRSWDLLPRAPGADVLDRLVREARACGVALAVSALPADAHRLLRHASERVLLRVDDVHDALALGVPRTLWDGATPPGRGVHVPADTGAPRVCQVLLPPEEPSVPGAPGSSRAGQTLADGPVRLVTLPGSVRLADLDTPHDPQRDRALLGVGGDHAGPVLLPVTPAVLVVGPAGAGRTTTLRTLAHGLRRTGRAVHTDPAAVLALVDAAAAGGRGSAGGTCGGPGPVVVLDDVELLLRRRPGAEDVLVAWVEAAEEGRADLPLLIAAARTDRAVAAYRGLLATLRGAATLVVLAPGTPGSAELAGVELTPALDPLHPARPGRAALVVAGRVTRVQVATP